MKKRDIILSEDTDYGFLPPNYQHLSMRMCYSKTKDRVYHYRPGFWRYRRHVWKSIRRKLASYLGWNVDKARSDFYTWCKEVRVPADIDPVHEFDEASDRGNQGWVIGPHKVIRPAPPSKPELDREHKRFYVNTGHRLLGYRINPDLLKHREMIDTVTRVFHWKYIPELVPVEVYTRISSTPTYQISYKFSELYGVSYSRRGKYWKPEYGKYGKSLRYIFEAVYSPDVWERKSREILRKERKQRMTDRARNRYRPKAEKKKRRRHNMEIYDSAILEAKGVAARSEAENLVTIERLGFTKDSFKKFGGQPNIR